MKKKLIVIAAATALIGAALLADSRFNISVTEHSLSFKSLPKEFEGFRIALISDLHGWTFGEDNTRLVRAVRETHPDLIAITGDMVSRSSHLESVEDFLRGVEGIAPIYYVNGNHEWAGRLNGDVEELMERYGAVCLSNRYQSFEKDGGRIVICGAEDKNGPADMIKPYGLAEKLRAEYPEDFVLWLYHRNDSIIDYPKLPVELILSGHAHGGIIRLPFVGGLLNVRGSIGAEYDNGIYTLGNLNMVVSRGLGNAIIVPRFLNRPELPVITLHCEE